MPRMKPRPGQLSLFELDARGEPLVQQIEAPPPRSVATDVPANHDKSRGFATGNGDDPLALLASYLTRLAPAPATRAPCEAADLRQARDDWLRRLQASRRSKS